MKQYILLLITIFYSLTVLAGEYTDSTNIKTDDSLHFTRNFSRKIDKVSSSRFYQMTYIGVPLTVGGIIISGICAMAICLGLTIMQTITCNTLR